MALPTAGAIGGVQISPIPVGGASLATTWTSIDGASAMQNRVVVRVALLDTAVFDRNFARERGGEAEVRRALRLLNDDIGIDDRAAIDDRDDMMHLGHFAGHRHVDDHRTVAAGPDRQGQALSDAGPLAAPLTLLGRQLQHMSRARILVQQR